jgi:hypothetical protein
MEETRVSVIEHPTIKGCLLWIGIFLGVPVLGTVGYAIILVQKYLLLVGYVWLFSVALLPTLAVTLLGAWIAKFILKADMLEIGPSGSIMRWFNKVTEYHPLGIKEHKSTTTAKQKQELADIPPLVKLLHSGLLGGADLLLGYHKDGSERWGTWNDLRTFVVGGKSRSGKTVTMVFFIVQALLAGAQVWVCDVHANKPTGLLKVIASLIPFMRVAKTPEEILQLTRDFKAEMTARERNTSEMGDSDRGYIPIVLVYDEWTKLLRDVKDLDPKGDEQELLVDTVLNCAEAWANFEGYAMVAGHEWTARESGGKKGAAIRRGFHSAFVHRIDEEYAKFLLVGSIGKKAAKTAPNLPTGHVHFQDSESELDYLIIPYYGKQKEAIHEVVEMLKALPDTSRKLLEGPSYEDTYQGYPNPLNETVHTFTGDKQDVNIAAKPIEANSLTVYTDVNNIELDTVDSPVNTTSVNAIAGTTREVNELIKRMHKRGIPLRDIAYTVGMYGSGYTKFQELCIQLGIVEKSSQQ